MIKPLQNLLLITTLLATSLNATQRITKPVLISDTKTNFKSKTYTAVKKQPDTKEFLPLFDVGCDGIKYTGAVEQIAIDELNNVKDYLVQLSDPFTKFTKLEAAIFGMAFTDCLVSGAENEVSGDDPTSSSYSEILTESIGVANNQIIVKGGVSTSLQANFEATVDTQTNFSPAGIASKAVETKSEEGAYSKMVRCIFDKREKIYVKLYDTLSYQLDLKFKTTSASSGACNLQLKQEGETIPGWGEMLGVDFEGMKKDVNANIDKYEDLKAFKDKLGEAFEVSLETTGGSSDNKVKVCIKYDSNNQCIKETTVDKGSCSDGNCSCVNGINIITRQSCNTAQEDAFLTKYGKNVQSDIVSWKTVKLPKLEEIFINSLSQTYFKENKEIFELYFSSKNILQRYAIQSNSSDKKNPFLVDFKLQSTNNFNIKTTKYNSENIANIKYNDFLVREDKTNNIILSGSAFANNLIMFLANQQCMTKPDIKKCKFDLANNKVMKTKEFNQTLKNYLAIKKIYEDKIDFYNIFTNAKVSKLEYQKKIFDIYNSLNTIFTEFNRDKKKTKTTRTIIFKKDFFTVFNFEVKEAILKAKIRNDYVLVNKIKRFFSSFLINYPSTSQISLNTLQKQINDNRSNRMETKKQNMDNMKLNIMINSQKLKNLSIFDY